MSHDITSAALYFKPTPVLPDIGSLLTATTRYYSSLGMSVTKLETGRVDGKARLFDCCGNDDLATMVSREDKLCSVGLYCTIDNYKQLAFGWRGLLYIDCRRGVIYQGVDTSVLSDRAAVLQHVYHSSIKVAHVKYGISYYRRLSKGPLLFALGIVAGLGYDKASQTEADKLSAWLDETKGLRRYLDDKFRGVYAANLLSPRHLHAPVFSDSALSSSIGILSKLSEDIYLWCLSDQEVPIAEHMLAQLHLLI